MCQQTAAWHEFQGWASLAGLGPKNAMLRIDMALHVLQIQRPQEENNNEDSTSCSIPAATLLLVSADQEPAALAVLAAVYGISKPGLDDLTGAQVLQVIRTLACMLCEPYSRTMSATCLPVLRSWECMNFT